MVLSPRGAKRGILYTGIASMKLHLEELVEKRGRGKSNAEIEKTRVDVRVRGRRLYLFTLRESYDMHNKSTNAIHGFLLSQMSYS